VLCGGSYLGYDATYGAEFEHAAKIKWSMESYTNYPDTEVCPMFFLVCVCRAPGLAQHCMQAGLSAG
jgi:hypothetical protein